jgi:hypothetical protein
VHNLSSVYFINFIYNLYMFQTSPGPSSEGTNVSHPMPYISWISSMNSGPLETPWRYSNISTNHHFSYHTNSSMYNYSIITLNSLQNNTLMNKILCSIHFTIDIIRHTPPDIPISTSISSQPYQFHSIMRARQSAIQVHPPIYQLYSYCIICISFNYLSINVI